MNEKKNIIKQHKEKIKRIKKYNNAYFSKDNPEITDAEYDKLKLSIIELETKYQFLKKMESIDQVIGAAPSNKFKKI